MCVCARSWCLIAAARALWTPGAPLSRRERTTEPALLLLRALLCGLSVALLGWLAAARGRQHLLLMGAMQASASFAAWGACCTPQAGARAKSPPPPVPDDDIEGGTNGGADYSNGPPLAAPPVRKASSLTLPRGWRYHRSSGMFEHKRSGRLQYEPPLETGSPLHADLPPCAEERGGCWESSSSAHDSHGERGGGSHLSDSDSGSDSWPGSRKGRCRRSRTWAYHPRGAGGSERGSEHSGGSSRSSSRAPMSVWELREALGEKGGPDATRRRASGGGGSSHDDYQAYEQGAPTPSRKARGSHHEHGG